VLSVRDNGRGITEEELRDPAALGLLGMSERARLFGGDVKITGARGEGTEVEARLPLHNGAE
jgi:signal transduction histidine kinase